MKEIHVEVDRFRVVCAHEAVGFASERFGVPERGVVGVSRVEVEVDTISEMVLELGDPICGWEVGVDEFAGVVDDSFGEVDVEGVVFVVDDVEVILVVWENVGAGGVWVWSLHGLSI